MSSLLDNCEIQIWFLTLFLNIICEILVFSKQNNENIKNKQKHKAFKIIFILSHIKTFF